MDHMHSSIKLVNVSLNYLFPDTSTAVGYKIAIWGGIFISAFLWIFSIVSFSNVGVESYEIESVIKLILNYGDGFYILLSAMFWMVLTFLFFDFPRVSGIVALAYVSFATIFSSFVSEINLYFITVNNLFLSVVFILLINPVIAGFRVQ
jgi:hypothetical protein